MILGKVIGNVVSTCKIAPLEGFKLLLVRPIGPGENPAEKPGKTIVALDTVQAGVGDTVLIIDEGNSARSILKDSSAPVRTVIVGIVDEINRSR
ncbi:MAG: EutN/CcmL family microcompartment protein [Spirochaetales bacterium]|nr:EutN/CcmL family microcompartment protein [Spirochaetales bacterium]